MELTHGEIMSMFDGAGDFVVRELNCGQFKLWAYSIDGLTSGLAISDYIIKPISQQLRAEKMDELYRLALRGLIYNAVAVSCKDGLDAARKLVNGFCVVLFPGVGAIAFEVKTGEKRNPSPPEVENTVKGPKDAFVETGRTNTSLVRRHLRTPDLRIYETTVGQRSLTNVSVLWIQGLTNEVYVERLKKRLKEIHIDGLISPSAVEEYVTGSRATAFPLIQYTERPDKFCQGLLDGRVGLIVDGLPLAYLTPVDLTYLMDSPEDRSRDYITASAVRILRYLALVMGLLLPGLYIAVANFRQDLIPLPLLRAIIESKAAVPFTTVAEVLGLLITFELLQESGVHLPQAVGQSVSIVGGIVVGTAAVEAGIISPIALIVVSVAGVCGFVLPNRDLAEAVRMWRFLIAVFGAIAGLWGVAAGLLCLLIHLTGLKSMGVPYLGSNGKWGLLRRRLKNQKWRNAALKPRDEKNQE